MLTENSKNSLANKDQSEKSPPSTQNQTGIHILRENVFCGNNISLSTHLELILNKSSQAVFTHAAVK